MTFDLRNSKTGSEHPLMQLPREDLDLIVALVLRSGSLKELAEAYGVSYPTIRARLDRLIARLEAAVAGRTPDPLTELVASLVERGELSTGGARAIRDLARAVQEQRVAATVDAAPVKSVGESGKEVKRGV